MLRKLSVVSLFLFLVACGKNDAVRPVGNGVPQSAPGYYPQAPMPPGGGGYYPPGNGSPYFNPNQMPSGYPQQFYPWAPIYQYHQQSPQQQNVFVNVWNNWNVYVNYVNQIYYYQQPVSVYDFNTFWNDFCPSYYPEMNNYFQDYYWWVGSYGSYDSFDPYSDGSYFWQNYYGMPYDSCSGYCWY